jgi:acyl-coenzyme A thioesterase 13
MAYLITDGTGAQRHFGYVIVMPEAGDADTVSVYLDVQPEHLNRHDSVHGGIVAVLLDTVCGMQCSQSADATTLPPCMTVSLSTLFIAPAKSGRITATATHEGGERRTRFMAARLVDEAGTLIATASAVMHMV